MPVISNGAREPSRMSASTLWSQDSAGRGSDLGIGGYNHFVGSLHLYDRNERQARQYLAEGWQEKLGMPSKTCTFRRSQGSGPDG